MPRITSTIWDIDPHTQAKHEILRRYLQAWFPILARYHGRIIYLDGFAGPGVYSNGEEGSPIIAIKTALEHQLRQQFRAEIIFYFIEKDAKRARKLEEVLQDRFPELPDKMEYQVIGSEFAPTLNQILDHLEEEQLNLAPTLAFLDPFGFSGFPMELISRMLDYRSCEVLITFMAGFVNRFLIDQREKALDELFGSKDWRNLVDNRPRDVISLETDRQSEVVSLYEKSLQEIGGARYVRIFEMRGMYNQLIYCLVFGTCHLKGLEVMKEAMWKVDPRGNYSFSDVTDHKQAYIIDFSNKKHWVPEAANVVFNRFNGRTVNITEVSEFVITDTPYIFRKEILKDLEYRSPPLIQKVIKSDKSRRRRGTFPNGCLITFSP